MAKSLNSVWRNLQLNSVRTAAAAEEKKKDTEPTGHGLGVFACNQPKAKDIFLALGRASCDASVAFLLTIDFAL